MPSFDDYKNDVAKGSELKDLMVLVASRMKVSDSVVAEVLNRLVTRIEALESLVGSDVVGKEDLQKYAKQVQAAKTFSPDRTKTLSAMSQNDNGEMSATFAEVQATVVSQNNYTSPGSTKTALSTIFGKIWNFIGRLRTSWQTTPDDAHFPSEKLVKDSLDLKAPLASPELTGTPTAPTAAAGTNTTQIATTAFVQSELDSNVVGRCIGRISASVSQTNDAYGRIMSFKVASNLYAQINLVFDVFISRNSSRSRVGVLSIVALRVGATSYNNTNDLRMIDDPGDILSKVELAVYYDSNNDEFNVYVRRIAGTTESCGVVLSLVSCTERSGTLLNWTTYVTPYTSNTSIASPVGTEKTLNVRKAVFVYDKTGSTSVPVYIGSNGDISECTDDFVHDAEISKMVQVATAGTAAGSSLRPVYVDTDGVAKAGMYSSWESIRGNDSWINALPVGLYRSLGNIPTTSGTTPQYVRFYGLEQQGMVDFWVSQFGPNSPFAIHFTVDFTSSGPGSIVIKERTGYNTVNIESLIVYREKSGTSVRGLILKIVNSFGYTFGWRSTGNITSENYESLTEQQYTSFIASYYIITSVTPPVQGGFSSSARNKQRNYNILDTGDVKSTYSSTGTDPVNGTAVRVGIEQDSLFKRTRTLNDTNATAMLSVTSSENQRVCIQGSVILSNAFDNNTSCGDFILDLNADGTVKHKRFYSEGGGIYLSFVYDSTTRKTKLLLKGTANFSTGTVVITNAWFRNSSTGTTGRLPIVAESSYSGTPVEFDYITRLHTADVAQTYSSSSTAPISGAGVSSALATSLTDVEYVAAESGGGGNLNKTKNGSTTSVLAFMSTAEAHSLWTNAKANAS